ncbi:MAG: DsrE family protein [Desulfobacterales bacterium]
MNRNNNAIVRHFFAIMVVTFTIALIASPAVSSQYAALDGVKQVKAVFDVSLGSPKMANIVFWAVKNVYEDESVRALSKPPQVAVVFHGPAVKLISTNHKDFKDSDKGALDEFANMIRQMKKDGVKLEVCLYALKVLGVDPATIIPEVDIVGNGFISVVGYQAQGYSVVTID